MKLTRRDCYQLAAIVSGANAEQAKALATEMLGTGHDVRIRDLQNELSTRVRNSLHVAGITTLDELARWTETDLRTLRNFGDTSVLEVRRLLRDHDIVRE